MRLIIPSVLAGLTLVATTSMAAEPLKPEQEAERINYSLGHQIGMDFKRQGIELDSTSFARGIEDALSGTEPLLDKEDMAQRLGKLKGQITDDMRATQLQRVKERRETAERNRAEAQAFLEANAKKPGVTTRPSGLQYTVIREGSGITPTALDEVTIHYRGKRLDGREFDSSYKNNAPKTVRVRDMIPGIKEAVSLMQPGAKWELYIPPDLAYGRDSILSHQAVIVEIELLAIDHADSKAAVSEGESPQDSQQP